jgi:hypothetical protein
MRSIRSMGLALALALTITAAVGVGAASAAEFRAQSYPQALSGEASGSPAVEFKTASGTVKCTGVAISGTASGASSSIAVTPTYSSCKTFGTGATFAANSCQYGLNSLNEKHPFTGSAGVSCSKGGDAIEFISTGLDCRVKIPAQSALTGVGYENASGGVKASLALSGVKYTETGSSCVAPGEHTTSSFTSGFYVYEIRLTSLGSPKFEAESYPGFVSSAPAAVAITTSSTDTINCTMSTEGTLNSSASTVNVVPNIYNCAVWGVKFGIKANDCYFTLNSATSAFPYATGTLGVGCAKAGSAMTFTVPLISCEITIPAQAGVNAVSFEDVGAGSTRTVNTSINAAGLQYTEAKGGGCSEPGTHSSMKLQGGGVLKGQVSIGGNPGSQQGLWVE